MESGAAAHDRGNYQDNPKERPPLARLGSVARGIGAVIFGCDRIRFPGIVFRLLFARLWTRGLLGLGTRAGFLDGSNAHLRTLGFIPETRPRLFSHLALHSALSRNKLANRVNAVKSAMFSITPLAVKAYKDLP
jgi:hypothetical protein